MSLHQRLSRQESPHSPAQSVPVKEALTDVSSQCYCKCFLDVLLFDTHFNFSV